MARDVVNVEKYRTVPSWQEEISTFALIFNFAFLLLLSSEAKTRRSNRRCLELCRAEMLIVRLLAMDDGEEDRGKAEYAIAFNMLLSPESPLLLFLN